MRALVWSWFCQKMLLATYACIGVDGRCSGVEADRVEREVVVDQVGRTVVAERSTAVVDLDADHVADDDVVLDLRGQGVAAESWSRRCRHPASAM